MPGILNGAEYDDGDSSDSESITTVPDEEFPRLFQERDGRLFHSHGDSLPYPLPVDTPETDVRKFAMMLRAPAYYFLEARLTS